MNLGFASAVEPASEAVRQRVARVAALRARGAATVPLTLAEEKATNPFLRCAVPDVIDAAQANGALDSSPLTVFTALRQWRNNF
jgi:hydroxyacylglutathione hydrolase